jgi:glycosyltransferase involved in cell wall biosynthesis
MSSFKSVSNSLDQKREVIEELNLQQTISADDKIISYIGYMILPQKVKGMVDFLKGFKGFLSEFHQKEEQNRYKLLYIGDGEFSYRLKEKIHDFNLVHNVFLLGKRDDVKELLSVSDLLGLISYIEGFPNVLLEAMASKVPCLVSNVGDMKFIVNDTGYIIQPGDIHMIRENLKHFFSQSDEKVDQLKENAFQRVKNKFNIDTISKKLIRFYQLAMN